MVADNFHFYLPVFDIRELSYFDEITTDDENTSDDELN